jgi:vacuolar protein sorting-associated protein VTA1
MNINIPNNLKNLLPYLKHSQILEKKDPIMSYYCKYYVVQEGMKLRTNNPDEKMKKFLSSIIDQLEQQKKKLGNKLNENDNKNYVKNFALKVFQIADDEDRLGKANKNTAINFLSAAQFFDVLTQFEELTPDVF